MSRLFHARRNMQKLLRERLEHLPEPGEEEDDGQGELHHEAAMP
jgi:hypothetical protein